MSLDQLAIRYGTDKSSKVHDYCKVYERYFQHLRNEPIILLELGAGGYSYLDRGFESARMWREYFNKGSINIIDIYDKTNIPPGVNFFKGSQTDRIFLHSVIDQTGTPDIVIDDASHINPFTIYSFQCIFPRLKPGGIFVIEDSHSSYWDQIAVDGTDFMGGINNPNSVLNFFKSLTDEINYEHSGLSNIYDIESIHFHPRQVFIRKCIHNNKNSQQG